MSGLLPYYLLREFDNSGKLLSGGKMYFSISGTNTPKAVYSDAGLTTPLPNPVILSASGTQNIFLADGAYRIRIEDQYGAQVAPPIDGVVASNLGPSQGSNITYAWVKLYADLRSLTDTPDVVYVSGRLTEGDGGQGFFQLLTTGTGGLLDDDGIILTKDAGTHVYKRIFDAAIDPLWYGLSYGIAVNQSTYLNKVIAASVQHNFPALIAGSTYISQNIAVPANASLSFTDDGFLVAGAAVTVTFADNSHLSCVGRSFGTYVSPKIGKNVIDVLRLSYMGDTSADARMDKLLLASTDIGQTISVDQSVNILATTWVFPNRTVFENNAIITFSGTGALNVTAQYIEPIPVQTFAWTTSTYTADFGGKYLYAEQFGAVGNGSTDDYAAIKKGLGFGGNVQLVDSKTYAINTSFTFTSGSIKGGTILLGTAVTLTGTSLSLDGCSVSAPGRISLANTHTITAHDNLGQWSLNSSATLLTWYDVYDAAGTTKYGTVKQQTIIANKFYSGSDSIMAVGRVVVLPSDVTFGAKWLVVDYLTATDSAISDLYTATSSNLTNTYITNRALTSGYNGSALLNPSMPDAIWAGAIGTGASGELLPVDYAIDPLQVTTDYTYAVGGLSFYPNAPTIDDFQASIIPITRNYTNLRWTLYMSGAVIPLLSNQPATVTITAVSDRLKRILGLSYSRYLYNSYVGRTLSLGNVADSVSTQYAVNAPYLVTCTFTSPYVLTFKFFSGGVGNVGPSPAYTGNTPNPAMGWIDIFSEWLPPNSGTIQNMRYQFGVEGNIYNNGPAV